MIYSKLPTPKKDMKVDYLYYDPVDESVIICYEIKDDQSWVREVKRGTSSRYKTDGYLSHLDETSHDIQVHEIGPKNKHPEYFL